MGKISGVILGGLSTMFFLSLASGQFVQPVFGLIPAVGFGAMSAVMLMKGSRRQEAALTPAVAERLERLESSLTSVQIELDTAQTSVQRLTDERAFLERLLSERNNRENLPAVAP